MKPTLKLYDTIKTSRSFEGVPAGSVGAVLMIFDGGRIVEVEFAGDTKQLAYTVPADLCEVVADTPSLGV